ncbi:MAG: hypothetical protein KGL39_09365 [Patescibacteria group bacterium]|nr:hypothetical protein [Patescibacteria group bacterium]
MPAFGGKGKIVLGVLVVLALMVAAAVVIRKKMAASRFRDRFGGMSNYKAGVGEGEPPQPVDWTQSACDIPMDPAAVAEVQALGQMGSILMDHYGAKKLNASVSNPPNFTNQQLIQMMHQNSGAF